ncbi:MAG TPA: hypothetical protein VFX02_01815 [Gammaproteobacteria bacterium]|nr:hypothetical protein [Gammaproteobacteria bacterium]
MRRLRAIAVCYGLLLAACVPYNLQTNTRDFRQALLAGQTASALEYLELQRKSHLDRALYELNKGMVLHMTGDFAFSNKMLEQAKQRMRTLEAASVSETATALTVNDATRSYAGRPYELLSLYAYKTLNYMLLGQPDEARVEVLQADVRLREWESAGEARAFEASAFMQYLSGVVFETLREWDDALIAYRKAYEVYVKTGNAVPLQLQKDLLRLCAFRGSKDELAKYIKEFKGVDWESMKSLKSKAELIVFAHYGTVSVMEEEVSYNYSPELKYQVQIALPFYPPRSDNTPSAVIQVDGTPHPAEILQDIDMLARKDLQSRMDGLALTAVARMVLKKKMSQEMRKNDPLAGAFADIAGLMTERADTRSWITLPGTVHILRLPLAAGEHGIVAAGLPARTLMLKVGDMAVVSVHELMGRNIYAVH